MKYDVFISCKSEDYKFARQIYNFLTGPELNYKVFLADAELRKKGKTFYGKVIDAALEASDHLILFASKVEYVTTEYVENEWRLFLEEQRSGNKKGNIVTILKGVDTKSLPISLRHIQSIPFDEYKSVIDFLPKFEEGDEALGHRGSDDESAELTPPTPPTPSLKKWLWMVAALLLIVGGIFGGRAIKSRVNELQFVRDSLKQAQLYQDSLEYVQAERAAFVKDSTDNANAAARKAEANRLAKEKAEKEEAEQERLAAEKAERERLAAEQAAQEKAEKERRERAAREAAEKVEQERQELIAAGATGKLNGHYYVDLGLSVKWATCNVGASSPSEYGNYYAWGETLTKSTFTMENSKTRGKSMDDIAGNPNYDAACAYWGSSWRLPTLSEIEELKNNCTWTWTSQGGHKGYTVTGKNGNSIFLPAAGQRDGSSLEHAGELGCYWSSTPHEKYSPLAHNLLFGNAPRYKLWCTFRYYGHAVRPVSE